MPRERLLKVVCRRCEAEGKVPWEFYLPLYGETVDVVAEALGAVSCPVCGERSGCVMEFNDGPCQVAC